MKVAAFFYGFSTRHNCKLQCNQNRINNNLREKTGKDGREAKKNVRKAKKLKSQSTMANFMWLVLNCSYFQNFSFAIFFTLYAVAVGTLKKQTAAVNLLAPLKALRTSARLLARSLAQQKKSSEIKMVKIELNFRF